MDLLQRGDHVPVRGFKRFLGIQSGRIDRGQFARIKPDHGRQRPMRQGNLLPRVRQHQRAVAQIGDHFAPLAMGRFAPKTGAFQLCVFCKGRHGRGGALPAATSRPNDSPAAWDVQSTDSADHDPIWQRKSHELPQSRANPTGQVAISLAGAVAPRQVWRISTRSAEHGQDPRTDPCRIGLCAGVCADHRLHR